MALEGKRGVWFLAFGRFCKEQQQKKKEVVFGSVLDFVFFLLLYSV